MKIFGRRKRTILKHKRAIELSINFVVMMILGIAMLAGSLMLVRKMFTGAKKYRETVDAQTNEQIRRLITSGDDLVVIYPDRMKVRGGETGIFVVGVQNTIIESYFDDNFYLSADFSRAVDNTGRKTICSEDDLGGPRECDAVIDTEEHPDKDVKDPWLVYNAGPLEIKKNQINSFVVNINPAKVYPSGTYAFNVCICTSDSCYADDPSSSDPEGCYGGIQKIYVQKV